MQVSGVEAGVPACAPSQGGGVLKKLRHVGIVGDDFERTIRRFAGFGLRCAEVKENAALGVKIGFLPIGETMLEFICHTTTATTDPLVRVVQGSPGVINHLCFEVDDLDAAIAEFERNGARVVEGCPRPGAHGRIAFFYPETTEGILIELCQV
jgi:methylmalonyl-CoA/ethylmalonyl-CoA epimerase